MWIGSVPYFGTLNLRFQNGGQMGHFFQVSISCIRSSFFFSCARNLKKVSHLSPASKKSFIE